MFRSFYFVVLFVQLGLIFSIVADVDVSKTQKSEINLTETDLVSVDQLKELPSTYSSLTYVGDAFAGNLLPDLTYYGKYFSITNPTGEIQTLLLTLNVANNKIVYVNIKNEPGSFAVACIDEKTLRTSNVVVEYRVPASGTSKLYINVGVQ